MIRYIKGEVLEQTHEHVTILLNGIGLEVWTPSAVAETAEIGSELTLHTSFAVRQDAFMLFGFKTMVQRQLFEMVTQVSGIGPKLGLKILSSLTVGELARALAEEMPKVLESVPGIGKKTAKRLIIELSEKVVNLGVQPTGVVVAKGSPEVEEAIDVLRSFGCSDAEVRPIVERLYAQNPETSIDKLVMAALAELGESL